MLKALLMFIPTEAYLTLMVIAGIMMMIGMRKIASTIIVSVLAMAMFGPFIEAIIDSLPSWALILVMVAVALSLIRVLMGRQIFAHVASFLIYDLIRAPFRLLFWLLGAFIPRRR
jgi:hypothetical protein